MHVTKCQMGTERCRPITGSTWKLHLAEVKMNSDWLAWITVYKAWSILLDKVKCTLGTTFVLHWVGKGWTPCKACIVVCVPIGKICHSFVSITIVTESKSEEKTLSSKSLQNVLNWMQAYVHLVKLGKLQAYCSMLRNVVFCPHPMCSCYVCVIASIPSTLYMCVKSLNTNFEGEIVRGFWRKGKSCNGDICTQEN